MQLTLPTPLIYPNLLYHTFLTHFDLLTSLKIISTMIIRMLLKKIINYSVLGFVFILPIFFLPLTTDFYDFNKNLLLILTAVYFLILWAIRCFQEKKLAFSHRPFDLALLSILAAYLLSFIFSSTNKVESLMLPTGLATIFSLTIIYFFISHNLSSAKSLITSLLASFSLLSLISVYQFLGVAEDLISADSGLAWLRLKSFTPAGNLYSLAWLLAIGLILSLIRLYWQWQHRPAEMPAETLEPTTKPAKNLLLYGLAALLLSFGLAVTLYQLATVNKPIFLDRLTAWVIAIEAFKNFPLFGSGSENFGNAFSLYKPLAFNAHESWNLRFNVSSNFYLQILTTIGLLGLLAWGALILKIFQTRHRVNEETHAQLILLLTVFLFLVFFPSSFMIYVIFYLLLSLVSLSLPGRQLTKESKVLTQTVLTVSIILSLVSLYGVSRIFAADYLFRNSLVAAGQNNGGLTYNLQIQAIKTNPYVDSYRASYSQINLALANSLASSASEPGQLTDSQRTTISQLIEQAIGEAKNAVAVSPGRVGNWENLANIYRSLINAAEGADQWTITAYTEAIRLDPANPVLRVNLGGVFFGQKNYDEAIRQFSLAIQLKPDFANAHYNLASALVAKKLLKEAIAELQQVQRIVPFDSNDYKVVSREIEDLKAQLPVEETNSGPTGQPETLTSPVKATTSAKLKEPLKLPKEAEPPLATSSAETASPSAKP